MWDPSSLPQVPIRLLLASIKLSKSFSSNLIQREKKNQNKNNNNSNKIEEKIGKLFASDCR